MPWIIDEASRRAMEWLQSHEKVEMVIRGVKKEYAPFEDLKFKYVDEIKEKSISQSTIRHLVRTSEANSDKLDQILPKLDKIFQPLQNLQILSILNTALSAVNLVATVAGMVIIYNKLDHIDHKLDEIKKTIADVKNIDFEMQIAKPCRKLVDDYKMLTPAIKNGKPVSEDTLIALIRECKDNIISIYTLRNSIPMDSVLSLSFTLLPILANCIMVYYQRFYDPNQEQHPLHDGCMVVFDKLSDPGFIDQIQDYMFISKNQSNRQVNEYLDCHRLIVYSYKKQINQLLEDLKTFGSKEEYNEAMLWTRRFVAQQAKVVQSELESKIGAERAKALIEETMREQGIA